MADIGYAVGTEDSNGNFVEHGRFNNKTSSKADPVLLEHADSGNTAELGSDRLEVTGAGLRLDTGQSIEDGSGVQRVNIESSRTALDGGGGNETVVAFANAPQLKFYADKTHVPIRDEFGSFDAVSYVTSSSAPGTIELSNAVLNFAAGQASTTNDSMTANPETDTEDGFIEVDINGTRFQIPAYSP